MPSKNEQHSRDIERIVNRFQDLAETNFDGKLERAFLFWAVDTYLDQAGNRPTEDDLLSNITDGKGDLELDAYYIDDEEQTVYLFQSKFRSSPDTLKMKDLLNFLDVPRKLTTPQILTTITNEHLLEFAPPFRSCLLEEYRLELVYVTTQRSTKPVLARAGLWSEESLVLEVGGTFIDVDHMASICDINDLLRIIDSLSEHKEIEIGLKLEEKSFHLASSGGFRCLAATITLDELASMFDKHRYAIFRYNPRGPLGNAGVNREIRESLNDEIKRPLFHLMNNGLSAVCAAFTDPKEGVDGYTTTVRDFQIVNGCQTTFTVWDHWRRAGELEDAKVMLKLVEGSQSLRHWISSSSNKQSQMKDWDFLFDDDDQQRLQKEFMELDPPIFYELRRGEQKYVAQNKDEKVAIRDIAQATWAFLGSPGEAKDRLRMIARSSNPKKNPYVEVFPEGVNAEWLRLPWLVYKRVQEEWRAYYMETQERGDYREHGRLHIVWLIGRGLIQQHSLGNYKGIPRSEAIELSDSIDEWFPHLHKLAVDTIYDVVDIKTEAAKENKQTISLRQLFRTAGEYESFESRHDKKLTEYLKTNT